MEAKIQQILKVFSQESLLLNQGSYFSIPTDTQLNKKYLASGDMFLTFCLFPT